MTFLKILLGIVFMLYGYKTQNSTLYIEGIIIVNLAIVLHKRLSLNHL